MKTPPGQSKPARKVSCAAALNDGRHLPGFPRGELEAD